MDDVAADLLYENSFSEIEVSRGLSVRNSDDLTTGVVCDTYDIFGIFASAIRCCIECEDEEGWSLLLETLRDLKWDGMGTQTVYY